MLSKAERRKLHEIELRLFEDEPEFVTMFELLDRRRSTWWRRHRSMVTRGLALLLCTLGVLCLLAGLLAGAVVFTVLAVAVPALLVFQRRGDRRYGT